MKNVLLAGLTDQEAAAIEIMIGMMWRDAHCVALRRTLTLTMPEVTPAAQKCTHCVIDAFGLGMRIHNAENAERLLAFLAGRPAIVLAWSGSGWVGQDLPLAPGQTIEWVTMPYSSQDMRNALARIAGGDTGHDVAPAGPIKFSSPPTSGHADSPSTIGLQLPPQLRGASATLAPTTARLDTEQPSVAEAARPAPPAKKSIFGFSLKRQANDASVPPPAPTAAPDVAPPAPAPFPAQTQAPTPPARHVTDDVAPPATAPAAPVEAPAPERGVGLKRGALPALLQAFPDLANVPLFAFFQRLIATEGPQVLTSGETGNTSFVLDVREGWIASRMSINILMKVLNTPNLLERIRITPIDPAHVEADLQQRFGADYAKLQKPLDFLCWQLMDNQLRRQLPAMHGDLRFRLRRMPNFTMLDEINTFEIQLAALCSRAPQSIQELCRTFSQQDQSVIIRFAILSIISGSALVISHTSQTGQTSLASVVLPKPEQKRKGFFKSLLDKLF